MKRAKPLDKAKEFSAAEFAGKMRELQVISVVFRDFLAAIERSPEKTLALHNSKSLDRGLSALASAAAAMQKSIWRFESGQPLEPGELKPRSPGIKKRGNGNGRTEKT